MGIYVYSALLIAVLSSCSATYHTDPYHTDPYHTDPYHTDPHNGCPYPDPLDYTVHLPHETDCHLFYKCDHGKKVLFNCPINLHFNPTLEVCDWPESAGCRCDHTPYPPVHSTCPGFTTGSERLPNPHNCATYLTCSGHEIFLNRCPEGQRFDPLLLRCNWAEFVRC